MKLHDFVNQTLQEIIDGVIAAQQATANKSDVRINPVVTTRDPNVLLGENGRLVKSVMFSVAVTEDKGTGTSGGIGVLSGIVNLGSKGESNEQNSSVNRVEFEVPILLPK